MRAVRRASRGVTIVEVLITVGIVTLLMAITIPVLRSASMRSHDAKNQTSLRSTHQHFRLYANDNDDFFVNAGRPSAPGLPVIVDFGRGNGSFSMHYFAQTWKWPAVTALHFKEAFAVWHSTHTPPVPRDDGRPGGVENPQFAFDTSFMYSQAMLAHPWRFVEPGLLDDFQAYRLVRWTETAFPANKGLMFDDARPRSSTQDDRRNVSFVDGSVAILDISTVVPPPPGVDWDGIPITATPLGILGRDFAR